jgi:hypothetical protein
MDAYAEQAEDEDNESQKKKDANLTTFGLPCGCVGLLWHVRSSEASQISRYFEERERKRYGIGLLVKKSTRSSRFGPLNWAGSGGNCPTPVMPPQQARSIAVS